MRRIRTQAGFTLIELVIVTVIVGIMSAVLSPTILSSLQAYDSTLGDVVVLDKLRYATERLAREIRGVQYVDLQINPSATCSNVPSPAVSKYCISTMTSTGLVFARNYTDSAGAITTRTVTIGDTGSTVTLAYSDMTGARVLADELGTAGNLAFTYYQQDGTTVATDNTNVRYVQISLTLKHNDNNYTQRTRVDLRSQ